MWKWQIIVWALLTIAIATALFLAAFQISGRLQARDYSVPYRALAFLIAIDLMARGGNFCRSSQT